MNVIPEREHIAVAEDSAADFALVMADDAMAPLFPRGSSVQIQRRAVLRHGDLGLFFVDGRVLLRQYCEDYSGAVYLFVLNRRLSRLDMRIPRSQGPVCCFGRVPLDSPPPLPEA